MNNIVINFISHTILGI